MEASVVLTGGLYTKTRVTVYNSEGWVEDLPSLNMGRYSHGCGHFVNTDNQVVRRCNIIIALSTHDDITTMSGIPRGGRVYWLPFP